MAAAFMDSLRQRWAALDARERRGVKFALLLLGAALLWWMLLAPPLRTVAEADAKRAQLASQLQTMQALQTRAQVLQAQPALRSADALRALQASVDALGPQARLQVRGDRAEVTVQQLGAQPMAGWLSSPQPPSGLQPQEVQLTRDLGQASWSGSVVFYLPGEARP